MNQILTPKQIQNKYGLSKKVSEILINRGITTELDLYSYFRASFKDLHNPQEIPGIFKVVDMIQQSALLGGNIMLYGDYDVDGIASTAILYKALERMGANGNINYYISNRYTDGYGLSKIAINEFSRQNINLIVTLDCGITNQEEIEYAQSMGMEVVVIDHHEATEGPACPFVDLEVNQGTYPFRELCGAGITYKVAQVMTGDSLMDLVDLVGVATVADVVPLIEENRILVKEGLKHIRKNKADPGLQRLINIKNINFRYIKGHDDIGFKIAPMINAIGRLQDASEAAELMITESEQRRKDISVKLDKLNKTRKNLQNRSFYNAIKVINPNVNVIVYKDNKINEGVVGLVAGRLKSKFNKPAIVIGQNNKGSCRSVKPLNMYELLGQVEQYLVKYGGHEMAAGLTLKEDSFSDFFKEVQNLTSGLKYDNESYTWDIDLKDINLKLISDLERISPFGKENPTPLFSCENCKLSNIHTISQGEHLRFKVLGNRSRKTLNAIAFNMGEKEQICRNGLVDLIFELEINRWKGREYIQLIIKDIQKSGIQSDHHRLIS